MGDPMKDTKKRKKVKKNKNLSYYFSHYFNKRSLRTIWGKHWEIFITVIVGLIIGVFILPKLFR